VDPVCGADLRQAPEFARQRRQVFDLPKPWTVVAKASGRGGVMPVWAGQPGQGVVRQVRARWSPGSPCDVSGELAGSIE
jgi:hypothetical protein